MIESFVIQEPREAAIQASRRRLYVPMPERMARSVKSLRGVSYGEGSLILDRTLYTEADAEIIAHRARGESLAVSFQGQGKPAEVTDEDVEVINRDHSSVSLTKEDIRVFERYSANDARMRGPMKFTKRALEKFALDFTQGRGAHAQRQTGGYGHDGFISFGRTFAAKVEEATLRDITANWLILRLFVVTKDASPQRLEVVSDASTGILGYDSISFLGGAWTFQEIEPEDGSPTVYFFEIDDATDEYPRLEATEVSIMSDLGRVYGAGDNKRSNRIEIDDDPGKPERKTNSEASIWVC